MTAAAVKRAVAVPADEPLSTIEGAVIDIGACRFLPDQAPPSLHFAMLLGEATGRLRQSGAGGYTVNGGAVCRRLADLPEDALEGIVRRMLAAYPSVFALDAPTSDSIHDRIDEHFARAQRRWRAERGR
jgi:hypothetical protein